MSWGIVGLIKEIHLSDLQFSHLKNEGAGLAIFRDISALYNPMK